MGGGCFIRTVMSVRCLSMLGALHFLVDAVCAALIFSSAASEALAPGVLAPVILIYTAIAFAGQPFAGMLVDRLVRPRTATISGAAITAVALPVALSIGPIPGVVICAVGNALFHVGGAVQSARLSPSRATALGIFVAPGALGLAAGTFLGRSGVSPTGIFMALAAAVVLFAMQRGDPVRLPEAGVADRRIGSAWRDSGTGLVFATVLTVIAVRSFVGVVTAFSWNVQPTLMWMLVGAAAAGKAVGGLLADRFGHRAVIGTALAASIPLLGSGAVVPVLGITGVFAVNLTMPATLASLIDALPSDEGLAVGLSCLALFAGAMPIQLGVLRPGSFGLSAALLLGVSAAAVAAALRAYPAQPAADVLPMTEGVTR